MNKLESYIYDNSSKVVGDYLTAEFGHFIGFYIDDEGIVSHHVGESIGMEIAENERPECVVKCPGVSNIYMAEWSADFATELEDGSYVVTCELSEPGRILSFVELVREGCDEGDIDNHTQALIEKVRDNLAR